jgi:DNA-binding NarL/FixJ family response regulator
MEDSCCRDPRVRFMNSLTIASLRNATSARSRSRSQNRRASDRMIGLENRPLDQGPIISMPPELPARQAPDFNAHPEQRIAEPEGTLLLVQDPAHERKDLEEAAHHAGLQVIVAGTQEDALAILRERESPLDLLFALPQSSSASTAAALIRKALELRPDLRILAMAGSGGREEIRAAYEAGASSVILSGAPVERMITFLRQSISAARKARRRELRHRDRKARHASESSGRHVLRELKSWVNAPRGSRRVSWFTGMITGAIALLIGMACAFGLERFYRSRDRIEALTERLLEGMDPPRSLGDRENAAVHRWQTIQQIGLSREANEITRQYYQDHLQELRRQRDTRRLTPHETGSQEGNGVSGEASGPEGDAAVGSYRRTSDSTR